MTTSGGAHSSAVRRPMKHRVDDPSAGLGSVVENVDGMESALFGGNLAVGMSCANALVPLTTEVLDKLDLESNRDPERDSEIVSALRAYRNAAFVFRKMARAGGDPDPALRALCESLIDEGHDHMRTLDDDQTS
jgi:hypothetical protein